MPEKISDGKGSGTLLHITHDNRADVSAKSSRRVYYASRDLKSAYSVNWEHTSSGSTDVAGYLSYAGAKNLFIDKVILVTEEDADTMTKFGLWADCVFANGTSDTPRNLNLTSSLTSDVSSYDDADGGAGTITATGGASFGTIRLMGAGMYEWIFDGSLILGNGNTFGIKVTCTAGKKTRATVIFWEEETY